MYKNKYVLLCKFESKYKAWNFLEHAIIHKSIS